jgi:hypothetical protein
MVTFSTFIQGSDSAIIILLGSYDPKTNWSLIFPPALSPHHAVREIDLWGAKAKPAHRAGIYFLK